MLILISATGPFGIDLQAQIDTGAFLVGSGKANGVLVHQSGTATFVTTQNLSTKSNIVVRIFSNTGAPLSDSVSVTSRYFNSVPSAVLTSDRLIVVWREVNNFLNDSINATTLNSLTGVSAPIRGINEPFRDAVRHSPQISRTNSSRYLITWSGGGFATPSPLSGIYGRLVDDSLNFMNEVSLLSDNLDHGEGVSRSRLGRYGDDSALNVVWLSSPNRGNRLRSRTISVDGIPVGPSIVLSDTVSDRYVWGPSQAAVTNGGLVVIWSSMGADSSWKIWNQSMSPGGSRNGSATIIATEEVDYVSQTSVVGTPDGGFIAAWEVYWNGRTQVVCRRFSANGSPAGPELLLSNADTSIASYTGDIAVAGSTLYCTWSSSTNAYGRIIDLSKLTSVVDDVIPRMSAVIAAYPNPFNGITRIEFSVAEGEPDALLIYDLSGRLVRRLSPDVKTGTKVIFSWDARSDEGQQVSSGPYFLKGHSGGTTLSGRVLYLK